MDPAGIASAAAICWEEADPAAFGADDRRGGRAAGHPEAVGQQGRRRGGAHQRFPEKKSTI